MRSPSTAAKVREFLDKLGAKIGGPARIYLVGGASAVLEGWRDSTLDIDLVAEPEPPGFYEAILELKESLDLNVELAHPAQFLPELPGWRERSPWIFRSGRADIFHYDFYSQALAKLERGHPRDLEDLAAYARLGLVRAEELRGLFHAIRDHLVRFPAVDAATLAHKVEEWTP